MVESGPRVGVGAIVVREGALLMVLRGKDPGRGLWSVPGGRVEAGEYLFDAVKREVREETGLDVEVGDLLGIHEVVGDPHYVIMDYSATVVGELTPVAGADADEARWIPFEEVQTLDLTPRFVETLRGWRVL
jgi:8-oxo-dGTP diphosphatase